MLRLEVGLVLHLGAGVDVVAHVVEFITPLGGEGCLAQGAQLAEAPALVVCMVEEVDCADGVREEVEDGHCNEAAVEAVALVVGAEVLCGGGGWGGG